MRLQQKLLGSTEDGNSISWGTESKSKDIKATTEDNTINVTGFDYSNEYIAPGHNGEKLVVTIKGVIPKDSAATGGKGLRSQVGTMYGTLAKGPRYLEMTDGYVTGIALDADDEIIGYKFINFGKMMDFIKAGDDANTAFEKASGQYGRVADAVKIVDPRKE